MREQDLVSTMSKGKENGLVINQDTLPVIESMAEGLPGGFFIYHADGGEEFIYVNSQMVKIMGCRTEEEFRHLTGNSFRGLVHPDDLASVEAGIETQIDSDPNRIDRVKYRVIRADGTLIWIDETGHFVHTEAYGDISTCPSWMSRTSTAMRLRSGWRTS